jgi:hypothetical protein
LFLVVLPLLVLLLRLNLRWRRERFDNRRVDLLNGRQRFNPNRGWPGAHDSDEEEEDANGVHPGELAVGV